MRTLTHRNRNFLFRNCCSITGPEGLVDPKIPGIVARYGRFSRPNGLLRFRALRMGIFRIGALGPWKRNCTAGLQSHRWVFSSGQKTPIPWRTFAVGKTSQGTGVPNVQERASHRFKTLTDGQSTVPRGCSHRQGPKAEASRRWLSADVYGGAQEGSAAVRRATAFRWLLSDMKS